MKSIMKTISWMILLTCLSAKYVFSKFERKPKFSVPNLFSSKKKKKFLCNANDRKHKQLPFTVILKQNKHNKEEHLNFLSPGIIIYIHEVTYISYLVLFSIPFFFSSSEICMRKPILPLL